MYLTSESHLLDAVGSLVNEIEARDNNSLPIRTTYCQTQDPVGDGWSRKRGTTTEASNLFQIKPSQPTTTQ